MAKPPTPFSKRSVIVKAATRILMTLLPTANEPLMSFVNP